MANSRRIKFFFKNCLFETGKELRDVDKRQVCDVCAANQRETVNIAKQRTVGTQKLHHDEKCISQLFNTR